MEAVVEGGLEVTNHLVTHHWDRGYDKFILRKGKKDAPTDSPHSPDHSRDIDDSSGGDARRGARTPAAVRSSADFGGAAVGAATYTAAPSIADSRRRHRNQLPSPERDIDRAYRRDSIRSLQQESEISDRVLREYERESDDPRRKPESVLGFRDLNALKSAPEPRRDSAMASRYDDTYSQAPYAGDASRPRSQPPRSRYYDDDDSDYDERSGRRYAKGSGRGYDDRDDRDYDVVREETERYRGPPADRPGTERRESYRSGYDGPYGAGAMTQYGRRSDGALDRQESYVSRRPKSRGRDRDDRSYSRSPSRSRSRSTGGGIRGKLENSFDTTGRGLGVGLAGAVIGGLAGRQFGQKHKERDIIIGALVGGLGANAAENKWREWKDAKEGKLEREEDRLEQRYDGRARSNVR